MATDELAARRWFRQRLDAIGAQYPELKTSEAQERLAGELTRQEREGVAIAEVDRPKKGRPTRSSMAPTVLKTLSFKASEAFMGQVQSYAKLHRQSVSELIRDGLEWRLNEVDPLAYRYGGGSAVSMGEEGNAGELAALRETITALATDMRLMREAMQALEQRVAGSLQGGGRKEITSNTITGNTEISRSTTPASSVPKLKVDRATVEARIHQLHNQGLSYAKIAMQLQAEGIPTVSGRGVWAKGNVERILSGRKTAVKG